MNKILLIVIASVASQAWAGSITDAQITERARSVEQQLAVMKGEPPTRSTSLAGTSCHHTTNPPTSPDGNVTSPPSGDKYPNGNDVMQTWLDNWTKHHHRHGRRHHHLPNGEVPPAGGTVPGGDAYPGGTGTGTGTGTGEQFAGPAHRGANISISAAR